MIDHVTGEHGRPVLLLAHSAREHTDKTHNNDLPLCREIYARLASRERVLFPDAELSSQALRHLIGSCDVFVASRFHAMVSSLSMEVPTLVIGWSHKYREVLDMFGLADWAVGHEALTHDEFEVRMSRLLAEAPELRARLGARLPQVRGTALEQVDLIIERAGR